MTKLSEHERALEALDRRGRLRHLAPRRGLDFASNDYLGLARSREIATAISDAAARGVPAGSGGSRLLRGNHEEHEALEAEAAAFFGAERALFLGSGYAANLALFGTLPRRGDFVVHDEAIHASVHDGLRLSHARIESARHNDAGHVAELIGTWREHGGRGTTWIAVESLYSMDGDMAPLAELAEVAARFEAMLVVDEAHATGVLGAAGRGLAADLEGRDNVITLYTCGKALGLEGALVCSPRTVTDFLVNRARPFIYSTAPSPLIAAAVRAALALAASADERRAALAARVALVGHELAARLPSIRPSGTHIQPILVGTDRRATALAAALQAEGYDIRAIRPPTVPEGTARLRLPLTLNVTDADTSALIAALADTMREVPE
jgi:8-amino-7-oxononanoate synthase